jgi:hypothetical protein
MPDFDYKKMLFDAKAELEKLHTAKANIEDHLAQLNAKISALTQTVNVIAPLVGEPTIPMLDDQFAPLAFERAAGITMAVRTLFERYRDRAFTATNVREELEKHGWDWTNYVNPLSTIHTVLKRLEEAKTIKRDVPSRVLGQVTYCSTKLSSFPSDLYTTLNPNLALTSPPPVADPLTKVKK